MNIQKVFQLKTLRFSNFLSLLSLILDIDIIEKQYEKALAKTRSDLAVKEAILDVKNAILAEAYHTITQTISALARKEALLTEKDSEIARLKAEIEIFIHHCPLPP